jgi:glycosyltransferase involved in cell wall biosynthesis
VGRFTVELLSVLADKCDSVTLYPTPLSVDNPKQLDWWDDIPENLDVVPTPSTPEVFLSHCRKFSDHDLVHINYASFGSAALISSVLTDTPYVFTIHGSLDIDFQYRSLRERLKHELLERHLFLPIVSRNGTSVSVSEYAGQRLQTELGLETQTIYHGINAEKYESTIDFDREQYGISADSEIVLFVGRFYPSKGVFPLLKAFEIVCKQYNDDIDLVIVGGGEQSHDVETRIAASNLDTIHLLQDLSDTELTALYNDASVFALPSTSETFGLVFLEAMATSTPIVCANAGAAPEVVGDAGLVSETTDPDEIAQNILDLLTDTALYSTIQSNAEQRITQFSWEHAADQYIELYSDVIKRSS